MPESESGFTSQDRKTLITVEVELGHVRELLFGLADRTAVLEKVHVTREELRAVEIDIDTLRADKAEKAELKALALSKADKSDDMKTVSTDLRGLREDIETLQRWRWFERGIVAAVIGLGEFVIHFLVK